ATLAAYLNFKPTLIISGSKDCVVKDSIQEVMYNNTLLACKTYVDITDAHHCQFANNNLICIAGDLASGCGFSTISTSAVLGKTMSLLSPFLDFYLKNICTAGQNFVTTYNNLTGVTKKRRSCLPYASCGPLPVKLTSFTGSIKNEKANLYWNTASEDNVDHMTLERSMDGITFSDFSITSPQGRNGGGASYSAIDPYPFAGLSFYRLKTIDLDGSISYSSIVKLTTSKRAIAVTSLYPNPVNDILHVQLQSDKRQTVQLSVIDITGKKLQLNSISLNMGVNDTNVQFGSFERGTYIIQYINEQGIKLGIFKIVKN
ncbi:MAG: T9SS type A sorting domain-containing protein, partial [Ferruginibacter sp.]